MPYDYLRTMIDDVIDAIPDLDYDDCNDMDDVREQLYDDLWARDSVTGNGSGSYTFNTEESRGYVADNMELLVDALDEFGSTSDDYKRALTDPDFADVTIRCYLLGQAIDGALEDYDVQNYFSKILSKNRSRNDNKKPAKKKAVKRVAAKKTTARRR